MYQEDDALMRDFIASIREITLTFDNLRPALDLNTCTRIELISISHNLNNLIQSAGELVEKIEEELS